VNPQHELGRCDGEEKPRMTRNERALRIYGIYTIDMSNGHTHVEHDD